MIFETSSSFAFAIFSTVPNFSNKDGATILTRLSVHWAERMVAIKSWKGEPKFNVQFATGYCVSNIFIISFIFILFNYIFPNFFWYVSFRRSLGGFFPEHDSNVLAAYVEIVMAGWQENGL